MEGTREFIHSHNIIDKSKEAKKEEGNKTEEVKAEVKKERVFKIDEYYPPSHCEKVIVDPSLPSTKLTKFQYLYFHFFQSIREDTNWKSIK